MPRFALKDVDPLALTLCKQGANRQRIFLRKTAVKSEDLVTLPAGRMPILKEGTDWTTFYCVVAEPGAEEDGGIGAEDAVDVWASKDEIRKAAHRLLKNGAYVNLEHDGEAHVGCAIVESAVALADLEVGDATIPEGSWYVGIEPAEELRKSIEDGEIEAISLEGSGVRVALEKSTAGFAERIGESELRDSMWRAWDTLSSVIYDAFRDEDGGDPKATIRDSLAEFQTYLLGKLDAEPAEGRAGLAKVRGSLRSNTPEEDDDMGLADDHAALKKQTEERFEELKKSTDATTAAVEGLVGLTGKLVERVEALSSNGGGSAKDDGDEGKEPVKKSASLESAVESLGKLADRMDSFDSELTGIAKSIKALGAGGSSVKEEDDEEATRLAKARKDNPLAGLLA